MPNQSSEPVPSVRGAVSGPLSQAGRTQDIGGDSSGKVRPVVDYASLLSAPQAPDELGRLAHYRVLKVLGQGGMGVVFQCEDTQLERPVALKVMLPEVASDPAARERFLREARACAAVKNDFVVTIYHVGQDRDIPFLAMEFLQGESLDNLLARVGRPAMHEVLRIGWEIAAGLMAAHAHGLIHRDIKPANVWLQSPNGQVKLLDFGLARAAGSRSNLTHSGEVHGTPEFMSPEQARGQQLDARSDLFSLGAVLYTLCTGARPFQGPSVMAVLTALAVDTPVPVRDRNPDVPQALAELVERLLEKDPAQRPASAGAVRDALLAIEAAMPTPAGGFAAARTRVIIPRTTATVARPAPTVRRRLTLGIAASILVLALAAGILFRLTRPSAPPETPNPNNEGSRVIAVLPFISTAADRETDYLRDGIPGALMKKLSEIEQLTVRPYSPSQRKPDEAFDLREIGRQLEAQSVLAGRFRQSRDRLSVHVELVNVRDNRVVWVEQYERRPADLQDIETDIAQHVCTRLGLSLSPREERRLSRHDTVDAEAYRCYLQGRYHLLQSTLEGMKKSLACFKEAIAKDPKFAVAYAGLADTYGYYAGDWLPYEEALPLQKTAARKALELDDDLAEAHLAMGNVYMGQDYDWPAAEKELKRAIELKPKLDLAHDAYAQLLAFQGRFEESMAQQTEALEISPLSPSLIVNMSYLFYLQRRYDEAIEQSRKALAIDPNYVVAHDYLGIAYVQKGQLTDALAEFHKCRELDDVPWYLARLASAQAIAGNQDEARTRLKELEELSRWRYVTPECYFLVYVGLGDKDRAFAALQRMYDVRSQYPLRLKVDPGCAGLRADPRFAEWLRRLKLAP